MSQRVKQIRQRHFADQLNDWQTYHQILRDFLQAGRIVLEIGCGKGNIDPFPWQDFPNVTLFGLDPDPAAAENPYLTRFYPLGSDGRWPIGDDSIDVAV